MNRAQHGGVSYVPCVSLYPRSQTVIRYAKWYDKHPWNLSAIEICMTLSNYPPASYLTYVAATCKGLLSLSSPCFLPEYDREFFLLPKAIPIPGRSFPSSLMWLITLPFSHKDVQPFSLGSFLQSFFQSSSMQICLLPKKCNKSKFHPAWKDVYDGSISSLIMIFNFITLWPPTKHICYWQCWEHLQCVVGTCHFTYCMLP